MSKENMAALQLPESWYRRKPNDEGSVQVDAPEFEAPKPPAPWAAKTAQGTRRWIHDLGLTEEATLALLKETAGYRHACRVHETLCGAVHRAEQYLRRCHAPSKGHEVKCLAALVIAADLHGIGGAMGVEGRATARLLDQVGPGRWHASSGAAYRAAAKQALAELLLGEIQLPAEGPMPSQRKIRLQPDTGEQDSIEAVLLTEDGQSTAIGAYAPCDVLDGSVPLPWLRTLVREGLRRSMNLPAWFEEGATTDGLVLWGGTPEGWGSLLALLHRLEVRQKIAGFVAQIEMSGCSTPVLQEMTASYAEIWVISCDRQLPEEAAVAAKILAWCKEQLAARGLGEETRPAAP